MVLNVHGGPWARDNYGFDNEHQWLANRGYAVLSVNYPRLDRLRQGVRQRRRTRSGPARCTTTCSTPSKWAVKQKITTPDKVAIYGGSYGGYATLVGAHVHAGHVRVRRRHRRALEPRTRCSSSIPPYWKSFFEEFAVRVGDPRTEDGKKLLAERSPLTRVDAIRKPLLIAQGANDPRVKQAESDQIVNAMKDKNLPVTYVLYPDEGHGFARPDEPHVVLRDRGRIPEPVPRRAVSARRR